MTVHMMSFFPRIQDWNKLPSGGGGGGGGGTLIFSYIFIHRLGSFLGLKILNFNILGGFGNFWGPIFRGHFYTFQCFFLRSRNGGYFWGLLKFQIFLGA